MYVKVRTMDGSQTAIITISKLTTVEDFREMILEKMNVTAERQRLFYRGKQVIWRFVYNFSVVGVYHFSILILRAVINADRAPGMVPFAQL